MRFQIITDFDQVVFLRGCFDLDAGRRFLDSDLFLGADDLPGEAEIIPQKYLRRHHEIRPMLHNDRQGYPIHFHEGQGARNSHDYSDKRDGERQTRFSQREIDDKRKRAAAADECELLERQRTDDPGFHVDELRQNKIHTRRIYLSVYHTAKYRKRKSPRYTGLFFCDSDYYCSGSASCSNGVAAAEVAVSSWAGVSAEVAAAAGADD